MVFAIFKKYDQQASFKWYQIVIFHGFLMFPFKELE